MTVAADKAPVSIDYTGRDYYAIRQELISRVKNRVPNWQGTDPSDFGVALVEAFAYMGDLLNYYIDRAANESFLYTATQRETLLNLANTYGYSPSGYVSAVTDLTFTNNYGYRGQIGGSILEDGTASLVVPNGHPFSVDDLVTISSVPSVTVGLDVGKEANFNTSVYGGTYKVTAVGIDDVGTNSISYKPEFTVTGITTVDVVDQDIAMATGDGNFQTYSAVANIPAINTVVTIAGSTPSGYNVTNAVVVEATDTTFKVAGATTSAYTSGAKLSYSYVEVTANTQLQVGQRVKLSGSTASAGNGYNGTWVVLDVTDTTFTFQPYASKSTITAVHGDGTNITYASEAWVSVGEKVTITGLLPSGYNKATEPVVAAKKLYSTVSHVSGSGTKVTYTVDKQFAVGDLVTVAGIAPTEGYNHDVAVPITELADLTGTITNATYDSVSGLVTFIADNTFIEGSYVTITGCFPTAFNIGPIKIESRTSTEFTVLKDITETFTTGGTATVFGFKIDDTTTGTFMIGGHARVRQFSVAGTTTTSVTDADGDVLPIADGTWASSGIVNYADLPTLALSSGLVIEIGNTLIPKGTQVTYNVTSGDVTQKVIFSTRQDALVPFNDSVSVQAVHGEDISYRSENIADTDPTLHDISGEKLGVSTGETDQSFALKGKAVDRSTIQVYVDNGQAFEPWTQVEHIVDYGPKDAVYSTSVNSDGFVFVHFGDGISGSVPTLDSTIKATYILGGGAIGNVSQGTLTTYGNIPTRSVGSLPDGSTNLTNFITRWVAVSNGIDATGGSDPETNESIRYNAPRALRAMNRAVSLEDYANLALSLKGVGKASATAERGSSVTVYVAPSVSDTSNNPTPGVIDGLPTSSWTVLRDNLSNFLANKIQIGTTVTITPPTYTDVYVDITFSALPQYQPDAVLEKIKSTILTDFSYNYVDFNDVITPEEVEFKLRQVDGVSNLRVISMYRSGGSGRNSLIGEVGELFNFFEAGLTITPAATEARLSAVTLAAFDSEGGSLAAPTLTPTFSPNVFSYVATAPTGTTDIRVTPTIYPISIGVPNTTASITVNNRAVVTATASTDIPTAIGLNYVTISVTAGDGVTVNTYKITVNRVL